MLNFTFLGQLVPWAQVFSIGPVWGFIYWQLPIVTQTQLFILSSQRLLSRIYEDPRAPFCTNIKSVSMARCMDFTFLLQGKFFPPHTLNYLSLPNVLSYFSLFKTIFFPLSSFPTLSLRLSFPYFPPSLLAFLFSSFFTVPSLSCGLWT